MCLIVFAWQQHPTIPLLLAANRDEFHERPAAPANFWEDYPQILAGRDLQAKGTWLGVSRGGRFAAITNIRDPGAPERNAPRSRGELPQRFLAGSQTPEDYLCEVAQKVGEYQGFNLLVGDGQSLWYLHGGAATNAESNAAEPAVPKCLGPGIYGLSNAALDVPWPKVQRGREELAQLLMGETGPIAEETTPTHAQLGACLSDRSLAHQQDLAEQDLVGEMARQLSAQFIVTPGYGTRCCSTLRQQHDRLEFQEQRFDARGELVGTEVFELETIDPI
jgi:uncharacterized protein with NRDE domain